MKELCFSQVLKGSPEIRLSCYMKKPGWLNRNCNLQGREAHTRLEAHRPLEWPRETGGKDFSASAQARCWGRATWGVLETQRQEPEAANFTAEN